MAFLIPLAVCHLLDEDYQYCQAFHACLLYLTRIDHNMFIVLHNQVDRLIKKFKLTLILFKYILIIIRMQQILSKYARFAPETTIKSHIIHQWTNINVTVMQQTRPIRMVSFITFTNRYHFSQKKPDQKDQQHIDNPRPSGTYRSFNQRIMEILYVYLLKNKQGAEEVNKEVSRRRKRQKQSFKLSSFFKTLFWAIFGGGTIFYAELQQALFTRMYESLKRRLSENQEISKGKIVQNKILQDLAAEYSEYKQMSELYIDQLSYFLELENIIRTRDLKTLNFIESFTGNGVGSNIKRMINERMHIRPLIFEKFYYLNLKNPPAYQLSRSQEGRDWYEARELHYLLNTLIGTKRISSKPNILVIDEVQVLEHFFDDKEKQEMLNDILRQIFELQKIRNSKVICIGNSQTFFEKLSNILRNSGKLNLTKYFLIGRLNVKDLSKIIRKRTQYEELIELEMKNRSKDKAALDVQLKIQQNKLKFREIMNRIYQKHDNLSEIIRILKSSGIDSMQYYLKYDNVKKNSLLSSQNDVFFSYNPFYTEQYEYIQEELSDADIQFEGHLPSLKFIQYKSSVISQRIIQEKADYIRKVTSVQYHKSVDFLPQQPNGKISAELAKSQIKLASAKFQLLSKAYQNGFGNGEELTDLSALSSKLKVNLHDQYQQQAYLDLNRDGILHGLVFADRATFCAFQQIKKEKQPRKKHFFLF